MDEHGYIRSVHKKLPPEFYRWKINDNFEGGVADAFYSGMVRRLWVEYKFIKALPKRATTLITPDCSPLQLDWLRSRYNEGNDVIVIVGSPAGAAVFLHCSWEEGTPREVFERAALPTPTVAELIYAHCNMEECHVYETKVCIHPSRPPERQAAA